MGAIYASIDRLVAAHARQGRDRDRSIVCEMVKARQMSDLSERSAARPFDGDHANVVIEMLSRGITADLIHNGREKLFDRKSREATKAGDQSVPSKFLSFRRINFVKPVGEEYQAVVRLERTTERRVSDLVKKA